MFYFTNLANKLSVFTKTLIVFLVFVSSNTIAQQSNKEIVLNAFKAWEQGDTTPLFSLFANDATWTILGNSRFSKVYNFDDFKNSLNVPFNKRLATPLKPKLIETYQDKNTIIVLFEAQATLINGASYNNSYAWCLSMLNGRIQSGISVFDVSSFEKVMEIDPGKI